MKCLLLESVLVNQQQQKIINQCIKCDIMSFNLKFKDIDEIRELNDENYTINDLLNELGLSAQTIVAKQNGELTLEESVINDGDEIKLVQIIYGG